MSLQQIIGTVGFDNDHTLNCNKDSHPLLSSIANQCLQRNYLDRPSFRKIVEEIQKYKKNMYIHKQKRGTLSGQCPQPR